MRASIITDCARYRYGQWFICTTCTSAKLCSFVTQSLTNDANVFIKNERVSGCRCLLIYASTNLKDFYLLGNLVLLLLDNFLSANTRYIQGIWFKGANVSTLLPSSWSRWHWTHWSITICQKQFWTVWANYEAKYEKYMHYSS